MNVWPGGVLPLGLAVRVFRSPNPEAVGQGLGVCHMLSMTRIKFRSGLLSQGAHAGNSACTP